VRTSERTRFPIICEIEISAIYLITKGKDGKLRRHFRIQTCGLQVAAVFSKFHTDICPMYSFSPNLSQSVFSLCSEAEIGRIKV
jgi:hypothetical protein